jgi:alkanesulfonate monooxygenase SsuD/methylene tetrahydromethanopterin reductase-like flavin-dependent oxidoreductase (luciferase family)
MAAPGISVGSSVTNTETRDPTVIANAFATLSSIAGGRVFCGIGLGDSAVKYLGRKPATMQAFGEKVGLIRSLLHGDTVQLKGQAFRLAAPPEYPPPILVTADSPKMRKLAGTFADGAILSPGGSPRYLARAIEEIQEAARCAGRTPATLYICAWAHAAVAETSDEAIKDLRPQVGRTLFKAAVRNPHEILGRDEPMLSDLERERASALVAQQDKEYLAAQELAEIVGDDLLREMTIVGTPEECRVKLGQLMAVDGLSQIIINVHGKTPALSTRLFGEQVLTRPLD